MGILKQRLKKCCTKKKHHLYSVGEFFIATQEKCEKIDKDTIEELIDSMPSKIQVVIIGKWRPTK